MAAGDVGEGPSRDELAARFRAPIGTHDVLPDETPRWIELIERFARRAELAGFGLLMTPIFEHVEVFKRVGESTDVVRKEMYDFEDKGGRHLVLRPEGTAAVVRAFVQHRPPVPWKVWYLAPHFRYERPQKGRNRQHFQVGVEVLGVDDPDVDVEVIALAHAFYGDLGLRDVTLHLNSMGDDASRAAYLRALGPHLLAHADALGPDFAERAAAHPMRVLDSKVPEWQDVIASAPQISEYLVPEAAAHFERVQAGLDALGIAYELDPRLVRGFDYYTGTAFEFTSGTLHSAQNGIGGGGRYDKLAAEMGGPDTPGIGFGIGLERVLIACDEEGVFPAPEVGAFAFVVNGLGEGGAPATAALVHELRENGMRTERTYGDRSVKAQWKVADRSGARYAVMLGRQELERGEVAVKDLRTGEQVDVRREIVAGWLQTRREEELSA